MLKSKIEFINNKPLIRVDDSIYSPLAYTTYFDECGEWYDFIKSGYKMFFVTISFNDLPINNLSGFSPFKTGVFETETPDYKEFDDIVSGIIKECPDALIFPRIHISMPRKWLKENPYETVTTAGENRESLFSDKFKNDGGKLLIKLLTHITTADYSHRIAGYQLCGGTTQEWIHPDLFGSYSQMGIEKFKKWSFKKYGIENIKAPEREDLENCIHSDEISKYYEFCSEETTKTIEHFAKLTKEFTNCEQVVGVFYGYNAFVCDCLWGLHGLRHIIDSPYIDFFSSPCGYDCNRELGVDWGDMLPVDSLKLHNKLCFIECDIRTNLTKRMQDSRPGMYPNDIYTLSNTDGNKTVWCGPDTTELSISAIRKAFARQITKSSGIWWFDMWGGWYHSPKIMAELENLHHIYDRISQKDTSELPQSQVAFFIDERAYANIQRGHYLLNAVNHLRIKMGNSGVPFDTFMVEDVDKILHKYKFAIFTAPIPSESGKKAIKLCKKLNIPYFSANENDAFISTDELREILVSSGIHCYNDDGCVVYCDKGILGVHTVKDGEVKVNLPKKFKIKELTGKDMNEYETNTITFTSPKHSTELFEIIN
jgi:beta-galactosidase